jgi:hypothetical protein
MDRYEQLRGFLSQYACLSEYDISLICSHFGQTSLKKDEYFFRAGACCHCLCFLCEGVLGVFPPCLTGDEFISYFVTGGHFFTDPNGFSAKGHVHASFRALSPCTLWSISHAGADLLCDQIPAFRQVISLIREQSLLDILFYTMFLFNGTPTSRYERLFDEIPEIIRLVPLKSIALYLRIDPCTLSRIRRRLR